MIQSVLDQAIRASLAPLRHLDNALGVWRSQRWASIDRDAGGSDRRGVFLDLARDEFLQIGGRAALRRDCYRAPPPEPLLHPGRVPRPHGASVAPLGYRPRA